MRNIQTRSRLRDACGGCGQERTLGNTLLFQNFAPTQDDDEPPAPAPRSHHPRGRARSISDAEASMVSDEIAMGDADEPIAVGLTRVGRGRGKGKGHGEGTTDDRRKANEHVSHRLDLLIFCKDLVCTSSHSAVKHWRTSLLRPFVACSICVFSTTSAGSTMILRKSTVFKVAATKNILARNSDLGLLPHVVHFLFPPRFD